MIRPANLGLIARNMPKTRQLAKNVGRIVSDYFYGSVYDMRGMKDNALLLSSLILSASRIIVSNKSAQQARGREDELLRYKEAVRTTVREAAGFFLTYVVLRSIQRNMVDFFRHLLLIQKGLPQKPSLLGKMGFWRWTCKVPKGVQLNAPVDSAFPTLKQTFGKIGKQLKAFLRGQPLPKAKLTNIDHLYPDEILSTGVRFHPERQAVYNSWIKPWAERFHRWARKDPNDTDFQKLGSFLEWAPALIGSIPALIMSGFALERFSQNHAEGMAQSVAKFMQGRRKKAESAGEDEDDLPEPVDPMQAMPYAGGQLPSVMMTPKVYFDGQYMASPYGQPGWLRNEPDSFGNRYRTFVPY